MKKKINIARISWVTSIFLILILILHLVITYKVNYEYYNDVNQKLYFYDCDGSLCTSTTKDKNKTSYSYYDCWYSKCPKYKKIIYDDYVLLEEDKKSFVLFNYKSGTTISSNYSEYIFINNEYIIVKKGKKYGVIDINDNVTVSVNYDEIGYIDKNILKGYNTSNILAKKNKKYGIISFKDGKIIEDFTYNEDEVDLLIKKIALQ
ncbi:MAG: hypothetical protein VZS44_02550 [Bacilli bacterium]|nr:hypothetical protein [Bacilli bacterium]